MARGQKPNPATNKTKLLHSTYLRVGNGQKFAGYHAGEVYGVNCHRTNATKPCLFAITAGEMQCPMCAAGMVPEWRGYAGMWSQDFTLTHYLISEAYLPSVDMIPHRAQVIVSRAKNPISPIVVREERTWTRELPMGKPWSDPVDMLAVALALWKIPELTKWVERNPEAPSVVKVVEPVKSDGKPFSPMTKAAAQKYTPPAPVDPDELPGTAALNRIKAREAASRNGKHDIPPKG